MNRDESMLSILEEYAYVLEHSRCTGTSCGELSKYEMGYRQAIKDIRTKIHKLQGEKNWSKNIEPKFVRESK